MRILIVSWYMPPSNTMGAMRLGKLAKYLLSRGHDVRVLSARDVPRPQTLPLEFPENRIVRTRWSDVNAIPAAAARLKQRLIRNRRAGEGEARENRAGAKESAVPGSGAEPQSPRGALHRLSNLYAGLINLPDANIGWLPYALFAGRRLMRGWTPDLIFASGPPFTTLIVGHLLARLHGVPWVAEFRDRWVDDPYYPLPPWRRRLEDWMESWLVSSAAALTTVSEPWAADYSAKYGKPVAVVYNGYEPDDYVDACPAARPMDGDQLRIVYTGRIYPGRRDPTPLFAAMRRVGSGVRAEFYGAQVSRVMPLAEAQGVADMVRVHPHIPYEQSVKVQRQADILLFMQWSDPREQGNVPGKLFEYLAARRPILALGLEDGVPANIIRERGAGYLANGPDEIAKHLVVWCRAKREAGGLATLPESVRDGFSRNEQYHGLETFLSEIVRQEGGR